mgnify:CR=1 FL=1
MSVSISNEEVSSVKFACMSVARTLSVKSDILRLAQALPI